MITRSAVCFSVIVALRLGMTVLPPEIMVWVMRTASSVTTSSFLFWEKRR